MRPVQPPPRVDSDFDATDLVFKLMDLDKLDEFGEIEDASYPYWEKWKYLAESWKVDPKDLWSFVKARRSGRRYINFTPDGLSLYINTPLIMQEQLHELDLNLGGSLHTSQLIPEEEKQRYLVSSLMEEAIASSQLEGAATTRKIAKEMLESNRKPRNHSEQMIVNNYAVMQWIVQHKDVELTQQRILEIHGIITNQTLAERQEEGAYRTSNDVRIVDVQTGRVIHTPPEFEKLEQMMSDFCLFANDKKKQYFFLHPVSKGIILHFLIGYIHPFVDGNGRTARALFYWYLIRKGYWLIEYMSVSRIILNSKARYARAYQHTELDKNDLTYFILYNLDCITRSLEELKTYAARKSREKQNTVGLLRNTNFNDRQIALLQQVIQDNKSVFTVTELETVFGISNQTARNDLNQLVGAGILEPRTGGRKIQYLVTKDALKKIKQ